MVVSLLWAFPDSCYSEHVRQLLASVILNRLPISSRPFTPDRYPAWTTCKALHEPLFLDSIITITQESADTILLTLGVTRWFGVSEMVASTFGVVSILM